VVDTRFAVMLKGLTPTADSTASIRLLSYAPNKLVYESNSSAENLAVFSEIYYDKGWKASIDGQSIDYLRCNYVLRGMKIPAGKHRIEFVFEPEVVATGERISFFASIALYGGIVVAGGLSFFRRRKTEPKS
jgi:uncharacterized membrane protein YfhO